MRVLHLLPLFFLIVFHAQGQIDPLITKDTLAQKTWVEEQYARMSLEEKLGQLFMVAVSSNKGDTEKGKTLELIRNAGIGGLIFSRGGPKRQAQLTNTYQEAAKVPLLVGMDAEWGLSMRLDSTYAFPWNMTLGAIADRTTVEEVAYRVGAHAKRLGVHINFAPDIDINTNPQNPIIGNRSFGEDPENVAQKGIAFMRGLNRGGVLASGKHFPGHGDTATDSHLALPTINFNRQRLDSMELYPFKRLVHEGLESVMVAHLNVPALEIQEGLPSSLSEQIISGILQEQMGFRGLVFTDALNMKGAADYAGEDEVALTAFLAGNDILLMPKDVYKAKARLLEAYNRGRLSETRLERSVKKILRAKYKAGLHKYAPVVLTGLYEDLNSTEDSLVHEKAIENALTVLKNDFQLMGIKKLENKKIAYVTLGDSNGDSFLDQLRQYADVTPISAGDITSLKEKLASFNLVIVGFHKSNKTPWKGFKFTKEELSWLAGMAQMRSSNLILSVFAKPYALMDVPSFEGIDGLLVAYQNSILAQRAAAQLIFGAIPAKGVLPVSAHEDFPVNTSIRLKSLKRLGYSFPERVGMSGTKLGQVDSLVQNGLDSLMFPGAQVLIARHGKVIYNKGFGKPTYNSQEKITPDNLYDLASLTKILATLPLVMKMEEEGRLALNNTFQDLVPEYSDSELKNVTVLKALSHYGRLPAWIAFYVATLDKTKKPSKEFYRNAPTKGFSIPVSNNLYLADAYTDSIYNRIGRQKLKSNRYRYSDVAYFVMKKYIEKTYGMRMDSLVADFLYKPIGADNTSYNPLGNFPKSSIVPSEEDKYFRYRTVHGYVHDMGAAMQGGVGGHAGLFSNANDVAKIMQMYVQDGFYGGTRFLDARTVKKINTCYFCDKMVRRGVGFDKPQLKDSGPTCGCV
ncbi:MAG: glycoside hydrolase family 3 N-terminal domain-containing protein, partial [Bacteroidota bacterium]